MIRLVAAALAVVIGWAAIAKLRDRGATEAEFAELGVRRPALAVPLVCASEAACAVLLLVSPRIGALVAIGLLVAFSTVVVGVIRSGRTVSCACFGATSARPIDRWSLARNVGLIAAATLVAWA